MEKRCVIKLLEIRDFYIPMKSPNAFKINLETERAICRGMYASALRVRLYTLNGRGRECRGGWKSLGELSGKGQTDKAKSSLISCQNNGKIRERARISFIKRISRRRRAILCASII